MENYRRLIDHILKDTDNSVALIPHVMWKNNDDRLALKELYQGYEKNERVVLFPDMSCRKLKYVISKCRAFIGARTHATIAAYSSCVPTLVVGYSVKARGIARDLFGDVIPSTFSCLTIIGLTLIPIVRSATKPSGSSVSSG